MSKAVVRPLGPPSLCWRSCPGHPGSLQTSPAHRDTSQLPQGALFPHPFISPPPRRDHSMILFYFLLIANVFRKYNSNELFYRLSHLSITQHHRAQLHSLRASDPDLSLWKPESEKGQGCAAMQAHRADTMIRIRCLFSINGNKMYLLRNSKNKQLCRFTLESDIAI